MKPERMRLESGLTPLKGGPGSFVLQFGKYARKSLYEIGGSTEGLCYLHWIALNFPLGITKRRIVRFLKREPQFSDLTKLGLSLPVSGHSS